jgi:4-amino-4-deoxy-L-arabinose transferase-like glycosyltransferase
MNDLAANYRKALPFYFAVTGLFLIIICPFALSDGMFLDGLYYSVVAKNLSNGEGSFWNLHFSDTFQNRFDGHPPLAFGLQSILFSLFGNSRFIDKIYSLLTCAATGYIILLIAKQLKLKNNWIILLLWLIVPVVFWASTNNMLENTLSIFICLSVLFLLKAQHGKSILLLILSGIMLFFGFLTKGLVAFFPWTFLFVYWLVYRNKSFGRMLVETFIFVAAAIIPLLLLLLWSEAKWSIFNYLDVQVMNSLKHVETVDTRFFIVIRLLQELIIPLCICSIVVIIAKWRKVPLSLMRNNRKTTLVFILVALTGVLPIMISLKQSGFYILTVYPLFAIALGSLIEPLVDRLCNIINLKSKGFLVFKIAGYLFFSTGVALCLYFSNTIGRDKIKLRDTYTIIEHIPENSTVNILPEMHLDFSLRGYFARYANISLDCDLKNEHEYLLVENTHYSDSILNQYERVDLETTNYQLFRIKNE